MVEKLYVQKINEKLCASIDLNDSYSFMDDIRRKVVEAENEFYEKIAEMCLGRKINYSTDMHRFSIHHYYHLEKVMFVFDNVEVGEIKKDYYNYRFEFIPVNELKN